MGGNSGNRTAFTGNVGAMNNNQWNNIMNPGKSVGGAVADFGNCNSLILRCATPRCAGCTSMEIAIPIVSGCVASNPSCAQHGDALVQTLAAQMVSTATARANDAAASAAQSAAAGAAAQSAAQMEQMQMQMQQMQMEMAAQSAQSAAAVQAALEEQKQMAAQNAAAASAAVAAATPSAAIANAAAVGISADVLAREQIGGEILTQLENAELAMKDLKNTMQNVFAYAGCDQSGNNCSGPKRVKAFKQKAGQFFDPYEVVLDEIYDSVILAQSLGVDITDVYMMLSGGCNRWGKYLCSKQSGYVQSMYYGATNCRADGSGGMISGNFYNNTSDWAVIPGLPCKIGDIIPPNGGGCQSIGPIPDGETIQQNWLDPEDTNSGITRVGCLSSILDNSQLFRNRKKQATIDIETLRRMLEQDAPSNVPSSYESGADTMYKYCSVGNGSNGGDGEQALQDLRHLVQRRTLSSSRIRNVCVPFRDLKGSALSVPLSPLTWCESPRWRTTDAKNNTLSNPKCECLNPAFDIQWADTQDKCNATWLKADAAQKACETSKAVWENSVCNCAKTADGTLDNISGAKLDATTGACVCNNLSEPWPNCND
jgi:hypothetical protein